MRKQDLAGSFGGRFLPGNGERSVIRGIGCFVCVIGFESNDQPVPVHDNPRDQLCEGAAIPQAHAPVVDLPSWRRDAPSGILRWLLRCQRREMRETDPAGAVFASPCRKGVRHVVAIADASFCGVGWDHAVAGVVRAATLPAGGRICCVRQCGGTIGREILFGPRQQRAIHDRRLLARQESRSCI